MQKKWDTKSLLTRHNIILVAFIAFAVSVLDWYSGRKLDTWILLLIVWLAAKGVLIIRRGIPRWGGEELRCAVCGYLLAPNCEVGSRCSECGSEWKPPRGLKRGRWQVRLGDLGKGFLLLVPFALFLLSHTQFAMRWLPTEFLIYRVSTLAEHSYEHEWGELKERTLTREQCNVLIDSFLDRRSRDLPSEEYWYTSAVMHGTLTPKERNRYLVQSLTLNLDVPEIAYVGEPFDVVVRADYRWASLFPMGGQLVVYFGGIEVNHSGEVVGRGDVVSQARFFGRDAAYTPKVRIVPKVAGEMDLCAYVWIAVAEWRDVPWIEPWQEDGVINMPTQVKWHSSFEVMTSVEIAER